MFELNIGEIIFGVRRTFQSKYTCFEKDSPNKFESMFETGCKLIGISNGCFQETV